LAKIQELELSSSVLACGGFLGIGELQGVDVPIRIFELRELQRISSRDPQRLLGRQDGTIGT